MRDRVRKKAEKRRREQLHELFDLALEINGLELRQQEATGDLPTVFFDFSGHVGWVTISVHLHGWNHGDADKQLTVRIERKAEIRNAIHWLKAIKEKTPAAGTARESSN